MDLGLQGRAILVTGGSRGIGHEIALAFAREGADLAICARDADALQAAAGALGRVGARVVPLRADLTVGSGCEDVVERCVEELGAIDVLVSNAATNVAGTPDGRSLPDEAVELEPVLGKVLPGIRLARAAAVHMSRAGAGGRIVFVGGTSARSTFREGELPVSGSVAPIGLANAALTNYAKHLSDELGPDGITVNVVHPHTTETDRLPPRLRERAAAIGVSLEEVAAGLAAQAPLGRLVTPGDVAPLVAFLSSTLAGAITGQSIAVDAGACRSVTY